jgi:hypothetical protein
MITKTFYGETIGDRAHWIDVRDKPPIYNHAPAPPPASWPQAAAEPKRCQYFLGRNRFCTGTPTFVVVGGVPGPGDSMCVDHMISVVSEGRGGYVIDRITGVEMPPTASDLLATAGWPAFCDRLGQYYEPVHKRLQYVIEARQVWAAIVAWIDPPILATLAVWMRDHGMTFEQAARDLWVRGHHENRTLYDASKDPLLTAPPRERIQPLIDTPFEAIGDRKQRQHIYLEMNGVEKRCNAWMGPCRCGGIHINGEGW